MASRLNGGWLLAALALGSCVKEDSDENGGSGRALTTTEWTPATLTLTGPASGSYTFALASQPASGWVTVTGTTATYYPEPNFDGQDSFTYTATGQEGTSTLTVTVTVTEWSALPDGEGVALSDSGTGSIAPKQIDFTDMNHSFGPDTYTLTRGVFCRLFYDPNIDGAGTEGLWLTASTKNSSYGDGNFRVQGLDLSLNEVADTEKWLVDADGETIPTGGDVHFATDGRYYYAAVGGCGNTQCTGVDGHGALYQFDRSWEYVATNTFDFDRMNYRSNDMLLSYANREVFFGTTYFDSCGEGVEDFQGCLGVEGAGAILYGFSPATAAFTAYDLGGDTMSPMGGHLIFDETNYWLVGNDTGPEALAAIKFPSLSSPRTAAVDLTDDGQWVQGGFFDDERFFIIYHSGSHGYGDVNIVVYNSDFTKSSNTILIDADQTPDPMLCASGEDVFDDDDDCDPVNPNCAGVSCDSKGSACTSCQATKQNAQRPHIARVRDTIYYTYDFAGQVFTMTEGNDTANGSANWTGADYEDKFWECQVGAVTLSAGAW